MATTDQKPVTKTQAAVAHDDGPKSRLAMMLLAFFAAPTGLARAYIGDQTGMIRFWVYVASMVLAVVPFINILSALALLALTIWGLVDFFLLKGTKVDASGAALRTTARDDHIVNILFIVFIVSLALGALVFAGMFIFGLMMGISNVQQPAMDPTMRPGPYWR